MAYWPIEVLAHPLSLCGEGAFANTRGELEQCKSPKQAREHTMSATNDKPTPPRKHKPSVEWPVLDSEQAGLFDTKEIGEGHDKWRGEGHDKWQGNGWKDVESWIKIHPPSPAALGILTVGFLIKRTWPKKEKKDKNPSQRAQETADRSGGPGEVNRGQTCSVP